MSSHQQNLFDTEPQGRGAYGQVLPSNTAPSAFPQRDPKITQPVEQKRLSRQTQAIVDRLRQGPATNKELAAITHRFGARIHDAKGVGFDIHVQSHDHKTGVVVYALRA